MIFVQFLALELIDDWLKSARLLASVACPEETSVGTYLSKILEEKAHVDRCMRLVDAECKFNIMKANHSIYK